jgi:hypothetical protein
MDAVANEQSVPEGAGRQPASGPDQLQLFVEDL